MDVYHILRVQRLPIEPDVAWSFLANPANLGLVTPPSYRLRDVSPTVTKEVYAGYMYVLHMRALGFLPVAWVGEITAVDPHRRFVDQQKAGPFGFWHHEHIFTPVEGGVEIRDSLHYMLPCGFFGKIGHGLFLRRQLETMFEYRARVLEDYFGRMPGTRDFTRGLR